MNLLHPESGNEIQLNFIDLSGETFEKIFATRIVDERAETLFREMDGLLLFVTALRPRDDISIVDIGLKLPEAMPEETDEDASAVSEQDGTEGPFKVSSSPHQVQLVDLLDSLMDEPVSMRPARVAVIISAWDKAPDVSPERWLDERMPLLHQYLSSHQDEMPYRIYGVGARWQRSQERETRWRKRPCGTPEEAHCQRTHQGGRQRRLGARSHPPYPMAWWV
jgi:hypothetical protein